MILIAALIHRIQNDSSTDNKPFASTATGIIILLLLALASVEVRNGVLAKATGRAAEDHAPLIEILLAILTGMILIGVSSKHKRFAAVVYTILLPILLLGAYSAGWLLEPLVITQSRADHLVQAVERFQGEQGFYPDNLKCANPPLYAIYPRPFNRSRPGMVLPKWHRFFPPWICLLPTLLWTNFSDRLFRGTHTCCGRRATSRTMDV